MSRLLRRYSRASQKNFNCSIEESKDIDRLSVDELQASLQIHEGKVTEQRSEEQVLQVDNEPRYGRGR